MKFSPGVVSQWPSSLFFFQAKDGIRDVAVTGVQTCALPISKILTDEGVKFDPAGLPLIVRAAEGSLRDALSLLDTVLAYGGGALEVDATARLLGATAPEQLRHFAAALVGHDAAAALEAIDRAARDGEDLEAFA